MFKLSSAFAVNCSAGPVIRPCLISIRSNGDHRFDGEAHAGLGRSNSLVLGVMWNIRCAVEELVDAVADVATDDLAILGFGMLLNGVSGVAEEHAWFDELDRFCETFS